MLSSSTPSYNDFDPKVIPFQDQVIDDVFNQYDYKLGSHEILLSGSIGSAKSLLMAHIILRLCFKYNNNRVLIARKSLPDLKDTIFTKILEHLDGSSFIEGRHYWVRENNASIKFANGSEIISRSWGDKKYKKFRSLEISCGFIEELTENIGDDEIAYDEILNRCGRLGHVPIKFLMSASNPDSPSHWAYKKIIKSTSKKVHTYYSKTKDNPFLPPEYVIGLRERMDPKMALRMLDGQWVEITQEVIYYSYNSDKQYLKDNEYIINERYPIMINFDFNIGVGKPFSACCYQYIQDQVHVFKQVVIHGSRTQDAMDELFNSGIFKVNRKFIVHGDATGKARHTNSVHSDYDIISNFLKRITNISFEMQVPMANPPIRSRHNKVNAYCLNDLGQTRLWIYKGCETVDEALRLTQFKKGADLVEDDSKAFQHIGTALGYGIYWDTNKSDIVYSSSKR